MKSVSKFVIDNIGGTEYGPAVSFRYITRAIVRNTNEVLPVAAPVKFDELPELVFVGMPLMLGKTIGDSLYNVLSREEQAGLVAAARAIYETYQTAINAS